MWFKGNYIQSGVGNLGTGSTFDTMRAAAEGLDMPWEKCEIAWGDTSRHLPWSCSQGGSSTTHAHFNLLRSIAGEG